MSYELYAKGLESGDLSVSDVTKAYTSGQLSDVDVCRLAVDKYITFKDASAIIGKPATTVARYCRKLVEKEAEEIAESIEFSSPGKFGKKGGGVSINPAQAVVAEVTGTVVKDAVTTLEYTLTLGKTVHNIAYYYASKDPRYADALRNNAQATIVGFVEDAFAFYVAWQDVMQRLSNLIVRLYSVIDRYERIIQAMLPKLYPSIKYEVESKLALELIDRMILARLLGIKMEKKLPKVAFAWVDALGKEVIRNEVTKQLFGGGLNE